MPLITVKISTDMAAAIEAMRGDHSRERWLYYAARQVIEDGLRPVRTVAQQREDSAAEE